MLVYFLRSTKKVPWATNCPIIKSLGMFLIPKLFIMHIRSFNQCKNKIKKNLGNNVTKFYKRLSKRIKIKNESKKICIHLWFNGV